MSPGRFWIALVEVRPDVPDNPQWLDSFGDSAGGAFVHVMGLGKSPSAFQDTVGADLARNGWVAAGFDDLEPLAALRAREPLSPALQQMEKALLATGDLQFGRFFLYPYDELSTPEWLAEEAQDPRLSLTQTTVLQNLARMLQRLSLPDLDESIGLTGQGSDELEIHLPHRSPTELDVTVLVCGDEEITIDYEYGHVHFTPKKGTDWISQSLDFLYGALQGGVRVQMWADAGRLTHSRALILLDNGGWQPYPLWSSHPDEEPDGEPTLTRFLSFLGPEE